MLDVTNRIDFSIIFDVSNGNPNGDPQRDNMPRMDPNDGHGLVTDVCIKRKVRDYLHDVHGMPLFITRDPVSLNSLLDTVARETDTEGSGKKGKNDTEARAKRSRRLCEKFIDVRLFGAMAETGLNPAGRVRGPLQLSMARSLHPVSASKHQLTRISVTKDEDLNKPNTMTDGNGRQILKYAAYRMDGSFTPSQARRTGASATDLLLFFEAILRCWARDRASARGLMGVRAIFLFQHDTEDGRNHVGDVLNSVTIECPRNPQSWADLAITINRPKSGWTILSVEEGPTGIVYNTL